MAGQLASYGYKITEVKEQADVWVLNSCTVKNPSQDVFMNAIKEGQRQQKKLVLAGCVSQAQPNLREFLGYSIIGVRTGILLFTIQRLNDSTIALIINPPFHFVLSVGFALALSSIGSTN